MPVWLIIVFCCVGLFGVGMVVLYFVGRKKEKKQAEEQEEMIKAAQTLNFYVIDKKKMLLKNAGVPKSVLDVAPKRAKIIRMPILKVKIGSKVTSLVCNTDVFKTILPKQEVRAQVSGIYVVSAKRIRGPVAATAKKKGASGLLDKLR